MADLQDAATEAVARRYPHLTGDAFDRKVRRVMAIMRHSNDAQTWTRKEKS